MKMVNKVLEHKKHVFLFQKLFRFVPSKNNKARKQILLWKSLLLYKCFAVFNLDIIQGQNSFCFTFTTFLFLKVLPGCDCCVVDGKLVPDGESWIQDGKVYGK